MNVELKMNQWVVCLQPRMCSRLQPVQMRFLLRRFKIRDGEVRLCKIYYVTVLWFVVVVSGKRFR